MDTSETYVKMCEKAEEIQPGYLNLSNKMVRKMKFKVGDKVRLVDKELQDAGLWNLKIKDGIVTKVYQKFITVKRGKTNSLWHPLFWRKVRGGGESQTRVMV